MTAEVELRRPRADVVGRAQRGAIAGAQEAVDEIAFDPGVAPGKAHGDSAGIDERVVQDGHAVAPVHVDAVVGTGLDEIRADRAARVLDGTVARTAVLT